MDETTAYLVDQARTLVWSGFYALEDARTTLEELADDEGAGALDAVWSALEAEARAKVGAEATWPAVTDCDRLDRAFAALETEGVVALHNAGVTQSDGLSDVAEAAVGAVPAPTAYAFYHEQDVAAAIEGAGLWVAFGALDGDLDAEAVVEAGHTVRRALEDAGLEVGWDGDPGTRLHVPMEWRRRGPA